MEKKVYVVRHCEAEGQSPHAKLTEKGFLQADRLSTFFSEIEVNRIITSPFVRARKTAKPLAKAKGIHIEEDSRLSERVLSSHDFDDWLIKLEDTFLDVHLTYEGGESSIEAMTRVRNVVDELDEGSRTVLVTHGNLMALLLKCFNERFGFEDWQQLTNPDVFLIRQKDGHNNFERILQDDSNPLIV